jgi:hypothetical protein
MLENRLQGKAGSGIEQLTVIHPYSGDNSRLYPDNPKNPHPVIAR